MISRISRSLLKNATLAVAAFAIAATASTAWAETLLMPKRDARTTAPVVVWGVHTQAAGTACSLDFRRWIGAPELHRRRPVVHRFRPHLRPPGHLHGHADRGRGSGHHDDPGVQPGLVRRWWRRRRQQPQPGHQHGHPGWPALPLDQPSQPCGQFPGKHHDDWNNTGFPYADTSLVVLAFENQGYKITANVAPTGIYEKYIVRRGLNYVISQLSTSALGLTPAGNNPCVGVPAATFADCVGLAPPGDPATPRRWPSCAFAGSGALAQVNTEVAGITNGKTYGEILQRLVNALAWGQNDVWQRPAAAGITTSTTPAVPTGPRSAGTRSRCWMRPRPARRCPPGSRLSMRFCSAFQWRHLNTDGSFDYNGDGNPAGDYSGIGARQKDGIGLQGLFYLARPRRAAAVSRGYDQHQRLVVGVGGIGGNYGNCGWRRRRNKGCAYTMFNNFKGLKLQGITTLPNVGAARRPGRAARQRLVRRLSGLVRHQPDFARHHRRRQLGPMGFSCCASGSSHHGGDCRIDPFAGDAGCARPDPVLHGGSEPGHGDQPGRHQSHGHGLRPGRQRRAGPRCDDQLPGPDRAQHRQERVRARPVPTARPPSRTTTTAAPARTRSRPSSRWAP